jgi:hypothetical protein
VGDPAEGAAVTATKVVSQTAGAKNSGSEIISAPPLISPPETTSPETCSALEESGPVISTTASSVTTDVKVDTGNPDAPPAVDDKVVGLGGGGTGPLDKWQAGERILCFHGPLIYEAKIQQARILKLFLIFFLLPVPVPVLVLYLLSQLIFI